MTKINNFTEFSTGQNNCQVENLHLIVFSSIKKIPPIEKLCCISG